MSYVAPHLRNKNVSSKVAKAPEKVKIKVNDFPELVSQSNALSNATARNATARNATASNATASKPAMDFSKLFNNLEEVTLDKKEELTRGIIKLTQNGIVDSLTSDEREQDDINRNNQVVSKNMIDYYNRINKQRELRYMLDNNYMPEEVYDEYSSSDSYYSTEESEYAEDDPEQETVEF